MRTGKDWHLLPFSKKRKIYPSEDLLRVSIDILAPNPTGQEQDTLKAWIPIVGEERLKDHLTMSNRFPAFRFV
jgi:hypothetical protein